MELLFLGLALGCLGFLVKIVLDYLHEIPQWSTKVRQAEAERNQHETQVQALQQAKEGAAQQAQAIAEEIKNLEGMRDELKREIDKTKKEMARKGKIIMTRPKDEGAS
jgi:peptidoglycan hydrolase CwlO-like protein